MGFIVKELSDGKVLDYDPREVAFDVKKSPEYAWHATHWQPETNDFWMAKVEWWKSRAVIFAGALLLVMFIIALAVLG